MIYIQWNPDFRETWFLELSNNSNKKSFLLDLVHKVKILISQTNFPFVVSEIGIPVFHFSMPRRAE